ncbi:MAG: SUMF1/EgtB/PvdO family nonheme iron enzyme, partial [Pirellulales bacterium]|nr:SUMF1/EgtB/PvdO family nonheme iron enzyme [Pirellulales bacterium]
YKMVNTSIERHVAALRKAGEGAISFFYYSGHGAANSETKTNYLIPVDVPTADDDELWTNSLKLDNIISNLRTQAPAATHYIIFDACRNELKLTGKGKKALADKGFVPVAVPYTPGVLVAYATAPGHTAADSGAYARALAQEIINPGVDSMLVFINVSRRVRREIGQDPFVSASTMPEIYFAGQLAGVSRNAEAAAAWAGIEHSTDLKLLDAFNERFGDTLFGDVGKRRLAELKQEAELAAAARAAQQWVAMRERIAEELKRAEAATPGRVFRDCQACPEMVVVPGGSFRMGSKSANSEMPLHEVRVHRPFAVGKFEVTFDDWLGCVNGGGCLANRWPSDQGWGRGARPVVNVSWIDAKEYVAWLSTTTGQEYRLLTEAEWEFAARAGTSGDEVSEGKANCDGCGSSWDNRQTAPAGSFAANAWGLYDMHGNVWEWCEDTWHSNYEGAPNDGSSWQGGDVSRRIIRGGSWVNGIRSLRPANRYWEYPYIRHSIIGFRVASPLYS